jgi:hypothetical protein
MKKTVILALALLLAAALPLAGCELLDQPFPEETETDSSILIDPEKTSPETEAPLTPEEEALVELAAKALWVGHDLPAREHFKVSIHPHASNGSNRVRFTLRIGSYRTDEYYNVRISAEGEVTDIDGGYHNYRQFIKEATAERIAAAEVALADQLEDYGDQHSGYYLSIDKEGYLCLTCEVIVDKAFGDHEHKFFTERICKPES